MPEDMLAALFIEWNTVGQQQFIMVKWLRAEIQSTLFWCFFEHVEIYALF